MLLHDPKLFNMFFKYVQVDTFDVALDAWATFKLMLTKHKNMCARFMRNNFEDVFDGYNRLITSKNYVTKRQSLKFLGELLLDKKNYKVMMKYINDDSNLWLISTLLQENTKAIQNETFHVFKIFVLNPNKDPTVGNFLFMNKEFLIGILENFQAMKENDDQIQMKQMVIDMLKDLPEPPKKELEADEEESTTTKTTKTDKPTI